MKIYVASSWRNEYQPDVVKAIRDAGHDVFDFKNPGVGNAFHWSDIDPDWENWSAKQFARMLAEHPLATRGYKKDFDGLRFCDACVLVMPCGRSAHLEAGWTCGAGKPTAILLTDGEPELMYRMASCFTELDEVIAWLAGHPKFKNEQIFRVLAP